MATRIQDIDTSWFNATLNFSLVDDVAYEFQNAGSHDIYYHESGTEPTMDEIGLILRPGESWRTLRQIAGLNVYFRTDSSNPNYKSRLILQESTVFESGGGGTTNPGGSDQEVQFNQSGVFGGIPILTYDTTSAALTSSGTGINGTVLVSSGAGTDFLADDGTYKTIGGSTPGGADTQVQFNNAGGFDGISILTYDENTNELTSSGSGINGVLLDSSGAGSSFLSDDGTYQTITPTPGGIDTQFQYNNNGALGGVTFLTYNNTSGDITSTGTGINGVVLTSSGAGDEALFNDGTYKTITASAGGSDTQIQYNNAGVLGGMINGLYNDTTGDITFTSTIVNAVTLDATGAGTNFLADDGTYQSVPSSSPGGSDTQFQYNDSGSFGGVLNAIFNNISGDITLTQTEVNAVTLDATGLGDEALFNDGTYKAITASAGGNDTQIQYNNSGVLGGMINGLYNDTTGDITFTSTIVNAVTLDATGAGDEALFNDGTYKTITASAGGTDTQIQYNDGGILNGIATVTYNDTTGVTSITNGLFNTVDIDATGTGTNFLADDGTYKSVPADSPGGSDTQFQYNDSGTFGGVSNAIFNNISGDITLTQTEVNAVTLDATGAGDEALFNDGTYKAITATAGGTDTQVQYNDNGELNGITSLLYNNTTGDITSTGNGINGVVLDSSGAGDEALFNDGTYKAITASAGGSDTQIQYNNAGVLGGMINGLYNDTTGDITLTSTTVNAVDLDATGTGTNYLADDGTYKAITDAPGGSDTQFQYNDNGAFNGSANATIDNVTGDITLLQTEVNAVTLDATGSGDEALFNDGTYKTVTASAGGSNTEFQYNNNGVLDGISTFTYDNSTEIITSAGGGINGVILQSNGDGQRVLYNDGTYKEIANQNSRTIIREKLTASSVNLVTILDNAISLNWNANDITFRILTDDIDNITVFNDTSNTGVGSTLRLPVTVGSFAVANNSTDYYFSETGVFDSDLNLFSPLSESKIRATFVNSASPLNSTSYYLEINVQNGSNGIVHFNGIFNIEEVNFATYDFGFPLETSTIPNVGQSIFSYGGNENPTGIGVVLSKNVSYENLSFTFSDSGFTQLGSIVLGIYIDDVDSGSEVTIPSGVSSGLSKIDSVISVNAGQKITFFVKQFLGSVNQNVPITCMLTGKYL